MGMPPPPPPGSTPPPPPPPSSMPPPPRVPTGGVATAPLHATGFAHQTVGGERASFGIRLGAWLLDGLLYGLLAMVLSIPGIVLIISAFSDCSTVETGDNSWEIVCPPGEPSGGSIAERRGR